MASFKRKNLNNTKLISMAMIAICVITIMPVVIAVAQTISFSISSIPAGINPYHVTIDDFNKDGKNDMAAVNLSSNNVSIYLGNGAGDLYLTSSYAVGSSPTSVVKGDFNGDSHTDIAVANYNSGNVTVLFGTGTGSFTSAVNYNAGWHAISVAVGDLDKNGNQDLVVVSNTASNNISVLMGNGDGTFGTTNTFTRSNAVPRIVLIEDMSNDGKQDLVIANSDGSSAISLLLGDGTGYFGVATNHNVGLNPYDVAIGDFNSDGIKDLAASPVGHWLPSGWVYSVSVVMGTGGGAFSNSVSYTAGARPVSVEVGDFNMDQKQDLAVLNVASNNLSVLIGDGTGIFGSPVDFAVGTSPRDVAIGDFDNDSKPDLATANYGSNTITILKNTTIIQLAPTDAIQDLINTVFGMDLSSGLSASLTAPLNSAIALLNDSNPNNDSAVCSKLDAFINQVNAKTPPLTSDQAAELLLKAGDIKVSLSCS